MTDDRYALRCDRVRQILRKKRWDALLVTRPANVFYLTGFTGEDSYLLLTTDSRRMLSDFRFEEQLREECPGLATAIRDTATPLVKHAARVIHKSRLARIGFESSSVTVWSLDQMVSDTPRT
ncbi:MAG TPA: aminopeptidase P family N-terminal domain-containing protein, partial [Pirellulaceae bacterium]